MRLSCAASAGLLLSKKARTPILAWHLVKLGGNKNENTITAAIGLEVRPFSRFALWAAYERAINDDRDLFGHRWTFSSVIEF